MNNKIKKDDRTAEEMKTHTTLVTATDRCLSGWGQAEKGLSKCAWACRPCDYEKVSAWVRARSEMKNVSIEYSDWNPSTYAHLHIYVVDDGHPALN